ncbi:hypothetical protein C8Q80DRAFT_610248 [Daedaleopsis nitida]|nr:hypothetical protein C8Q80DRAFT_610248 [Daedaleopsis nitida]
MQVGYILINLSCQWPPKSTRERGADQLPSSVIWTLELRRLLAFTNHDVAWTTCMQRTGWWTEVKGASSSCPQASLLEAGRLPTERRRSPNWQSEEEAVYHGHARRTEWPSSYDWSMAWWLPDANACMHPSTGDRSSLRVVPSSLLTPGPRSTVTISPLAHLQSAVGRRTFERLNTTRHAPRSVFSASVPAQKPSHSSSKGIPPPSSRPARPKVKTPCGHRTNANPTHPRRSSVRRSDSISGSCTLHTAPHVKFWSTEYGCAGCSGPCTLVRRTSSIECPSGVSTVLYRLAGAPRGGGSGSAPPSRECHSTLPCSVLQCCCSASVHAIVRPACHGATHRPLAMAVCARVQLYMYKPKSSCACTDSEWWCGMCTDMYMYTPGKAARLPPTRSSSQGSKSIFHEKRRRRRRTRAQDIVTA